MTDRRPMKRMVRTFMYKHPRSNRGLATVTAIVAPILIFLMFAVSPVHVGHRATVSAVGPLAVSGYVYSSGGVPVAGATVIVTILQGTTVNDTYPTTTDPSGFYTASFSNGVWGTGSTIQVVASKGTDTGQNSTIADEADPFPMVDVHFGAAIPEFGGPVTTLLAISGIGTIVVFNARRRGSGSH